MMASTLFFWLRLSSVGEKYKSAMTITGLVTFIAAYHYFRIFNSWVEAYAFPAEGGDPAVTGKPFNDAYRYMDWLLTVPLLLIEISTSYHLPRLRPELTTSRSSLLALALDSDATGLPCGCPAVPTVFCMKLDDAETTKQAWQLGGAAGLMIILGYPGELIIDGNLGTRWFCASLRRANVLRAPKLLFGWLAAPSLPPLPSPADRVSERTSN